MRGSHGNQILLMQFLNYVDPSLINLWVEFWIETNIHSWNLFSFSDEKMDRKGIW